MLYSCAYDNFLSFKHEAFFDLAAPKNRVKNRFPGNYVTLPSGEAVLRDAVVAGENAGGKSNFILVFDFLRSLFVRNDVKPRSYSNRIFSGNLSLVELLPHPEADEATVQHFEVEIALGTATFLYRLELAGDGIMQESLSRRANVHQDYALVFGARRAKGEAGSSDVESGGGKASRLAFDVAYGPATTLPRSLLDSIKEAGSELRGSLFIQHFAALGDAGCRAVVDWFSTDLVIASRGRGSFSIIGIEQDLLERALRDPRYFEIFRLVDGSISAVELNLDSPFSKSVLVRSARDGKTYRRTMQEDSTGVAQFAQWALAIYLVVYENKTVFADEIDGAINPVLSDRVLSFINGHDHTGQFIYTTHNVLVLTLRTFMKEQIYFVSKDVETLESTLYSLADFKSVRYDAGEVYEMYLKGVLGSTIDG